MKYALMAAILALASGVAHAQSSMQLTESQAKSKFEAAGYSSVSGLKKNADGSWAAMASKGGAAAHSVMLDEKGNVVEK